MKFTAAEAARQAGVSKATISRAIETGRLSAEIVDTRGGNSGKGFAIDASELFRVYPKKKSPETNVIPLEASIGTHIETKVLEVELKGKEEQIALLKEQISDLQKRLDDESSERRKLTALITAPRTEPREAPQTRKASWWPFGKSND